MRQFTTTSKDKRNWFTFLQCNTRDQLNETDSVMACNREVVVSCTCTSASKLSHVVLFKSKSVQLTSNLMKILKGERNDRKSLQGDCAGRDQRKSWEKAAAAAINRASQTLRDIRVARIIEQDIHIEPGSPHTYRVKMEVSFKYEGGD